MREVTKEEYQEFFKNHREVVINGTPVRLVEWGQLKSFEPKEFALEKTTVWSFENRGKWATHRVIIGQIGRRKGFPNEEILFPYLCF